MGCTLYLFYKTQNVRIFMQVGVYIYIYIYIFIYIHTPTCIKIRTFCVLEDKNKVQLKPGIVVFRKLQSDAFVRLQTYLPLVLVIFLKLFGVLRKHCSEACGRRLCLVVPIVQFSYQWNIYFSGY